MVLSLDARAFRNVCILFLVGLWPVMSANGQQQVTYAVSFPNIVHHEAEISVTFAGVPQGELLEVRMSRTSPGRYALHEFAKNVYRVKAYDGSGKALALSQPNLHQWNVEGHDGTVRITYTLFGDRADGTYTGLDNTHAHMNMPATFMWARGLEEAPITVTFNRPDPTWKVATQLLPTEDPQVFRAPDLAYFLDSPTEISDFSLRTWEVVSNDTRYTIRLAVHHAGTEAEVDAYAEMAKKVVAEQIAVYGETPAYDGGTYTFIADYLPHVNGDGMEHRNSTILSSTGSLRGNALGLLGTLSHEFFHQWNVERIRPRTLEPFDFEAANVSGELWFAEGFTSYYDDLIIRRASLYDDARYAQGLSGGLNVVLNDPGRQFFSPVEMSRQAPFVDAATSVDPQNRSNTFISYYTWGSVIGLGLDLTLRARFEGLTLDDYMQALWVQFGMPEQPYTLDDLERVLGEVTGDTDFAATFFRRYIGGQEVVDYEALLAQAGMQLRKVWPGQAWLGASFDDADGRLTIASGTLIGSPAYEAGLDRGDIIQRLGEVEAPTAEEVRALLARHRPGDVLPVAYIQRGERKQTTLTLGENPQQEVVLYETAGKGVTAEMRAFREAWLGSRAGL